MRQSSPSELCRSIDQGKVPARFQCTLKKGLSEMRLTNKVKTSRCDWVHLTLASRYPDSYLVSHLPSAGLQLICDSLPETGTELVCARLQVGQRAAKGGAVGTGAAALGLILGALAAAFGGKAGERYPVREVHADERRFGVRPLRASA
jgi:hypothetical protein